MSRKVTNSIVGRLSSFDSSEEVEYKYRLGGKDLVEIEETPKQWNHFEIANYITLLTSAALFGFSLYVIGMARTQGRGWVAIIMAAIGGIICVSSIFSIFVSRKRRAEGFHGLEPEGLTCLKMHYSFLLVSITILFASMMIIFVFWEPVDRMIRENWGGMLGSGHKDGLAVLTGVNIVALFYSLYGNLAADWSPDNNLHQGVLRAAASFTMFVGLALTITNSMALYFYYSLDAPHWPFYGMIALGGVVIMLCILAFILSLQELARSPSFDLPVTPFWVTLFFWLVVLTGITLFVFGIASCVYSYQLSSWNQPLILYLQLDQLLAVIGCILLLAMYASAKLWQSQHEYRYVKASTLDEHDLELSR
eukprot:TRINITY_DN4355_c0_g3_i4.p1 TRINITY_DN4355_c0_g3~~TRINITY_DN4355_c0_g3_i4.p1  ORF type:complete len:364 (+),score=44.54 TRINITY_DN4355_c0_g3_i4:139-1230(+)